MKIQSVGIYEDTDPRGKWGVLFQGSMEVEGYFIDVEMKGDAIFPSEADAAKAAGRVWISVGGDLGSRIVLLVAGLHDRPASVMPQIKPKFRFMTKLFKPKSIQDLVREVASETACGTPEIMEAQGIATCDLCGRTDNHTHDQEEYGVTEGNPLDPDNFHEHVEHQVAGDEHLEAMYEDQQSEVDNDE